MNKIRSQVARLKEAVFSGEAERVANLIDWEIHDANIPDADLSKPLHWAVTPPDEAPPSAEIVRVLIDRGADTELRDSEGKRPVDHALIHIDLIERQEHGEGRQEKRHAYLRIVGHLRDAASRTAVINSAPELGLADRAGRTAVHWAAVNGDVGRIAECIEQRIDCDERDHDGNTPVMLAILHAKPAAAQALASQTTTHNWAYGLHNRKKENPVHLAVRSGCEETLDWVLKEDAEASQAHAAAVRGCNRTNQRGESPLHYAVRARWLGGVRRLLESGANPTVRSPNSGTPLLVAIRQGSADICRELLPYSPDFRHYDPHGESRDREAEFYLSQAIEHGTPEVVEAIVSYCPALVRPRIQHSEAIEEAGQQLRTAKDGEAEERARRILEVVEGAAGRPPAPAPSAEPEAGM